MFIIDIIYFKLMYMWL